MNIAALVYKNNFNHSASFISAQQSIKVQVSPMLQRQFIFILFAVCGGGVSCAAAESGRQL